MQSFYKKLSSGISNILKCQSVVKISVESVIESLTSKFEIHFSKFRNVKEETACNEMMVSVNGPAPSKSKPVVMAAMKRHFKGPNGIRFTKRSNDIRLFDKAASASIF